MKLEDYARIVGRKKIEEIQQEADPVVGKHIVHFNSTYYGGGVAEMLNSLIPLFNAVGIETGWRLIKGNPDFFHVTKSFHNALQGEKVNLTANKKNVYEETCELNSLFTHLESHDCVIVHDPQPLPIISFFKKTHPWIWRCHIDVSKPSKPVWDYLKQFIKSYDRVIVSKNSFMHKDLKIPQEVVNPSIDPLSTKNKRLPDKTITKYLHKFGIDENKPIISQVSRFDKWKDPVGVIKAYRLIKEKCKCQLVLLGAAATDDPESQDVYKQILDEVNGEKDIHVINYENNILVNVIQTASDVVIQKSLKEGFGLTVSEALWKETPVVASNVGGISLQVRHGFNGYLANTPEDCAKAVCKLLHNPKLAKEMGRNGREFVKENFLITRQLLDYVRILKKQLVYYKPN